MSLWEYFKLRMALIKCTECGNMISDKSENCIYCGSPISISLKPSILCPECGTLMEETAEKCTKCGFPFSPKKQLECPECGEKVNEQSKKLS